MDFTSESTFLFAPFWFRDPTPSLFAGEGGAWQALLRGWDTPTFASPVNGRHPLQGTQRGTPHPVSGTGLRRRRLSGHRPKRGYGGGGTPSVPTVEDPHPPVFPMGGGTPLGRTGGGHQSRRGVWVCPALFSRGGWVFTHSMRKNKTHAPSQGNGTIINQSAIVFIREQGLNVTHALNQAQGNPDIDGIPP